MDESDHGYELPIDGVLDLHLFRPSDCRSLVPEYLQACRERNILQVRIIHGKGRGVLRTIVQRILASDHCVQDYRQAPPEAGGWGATLVRLKPLAREPQDGR